MFFFLFFFINNRLSVDLKMELELDRLNITLASATDKARNKISFRYYVKESVGRRRGGAFEI